MDSFYIYILSTLSDVIWMILFILQYFAEDSAPDPKRLKAADVEPPTKCAESSPPVIISDALAKFFGTGEREMLQSEAVRRVWDYVRVNQLEVRTEENSLLFIL